MRRLRVVAGSESLISSAGGALLIETAAAVGLHQALSEGLRPWRGRRAVHDPGKVLLDLAVAVGLGGDCLADLAVVRAQIDLFGDEASDLTVCAWSLRWPPPPRPRWLRCGRPGRRRASGSGS